MVQEAAGTLGSITGTKWSEMYHWIWPQNKPTSKNIYLLRIKPLVHTNINKHGQMKVLYYIRMTIKHHLY